MSSFTTRNLSSHRVLVKGTDADGTTGETVLNGAEWASLKAKSDFSNAEANFDEMVDKFFAPLIEATEQLASAAQPKAPDPASVLVLKEGTPGTAAVESETYSLGHDSIVLRLIEEGTFDRLIWVDGNLEVLELEEPAPVPPATYVDRSGETQVSGA